MLRLINISVDRRVFINLNILNVKYNVKLSYLYSG